jgi:hypothetical protein
MLHVCSVGTGVDMHILHDLLFVRFIRGGWHNMYDCGGIPEKAGEVV